MRCAKRRVVRPAPGLGEQHEIERRRVDRAVVAREPELGAPSLTYLVHDLPRLGVDRRVLLVRLQLGERVERADRDLRPEQKRLQRRDRRVAAEDGHEPRHPGGEKRPATVARAHAQRREIRDRAVEGAPQALPAAAHARDAQRPGGDDVARGLALLVELLHRLDVVLEPWQHVDAEIPALVRIERERVGHRRCRRGVPGFEKTSRVPRSPRGSTIETWRRFLVVGRRCGRRQRLRVLGVAEREVVELHRDDVREVGLGLERDRRARAARALSLRSEIRSCIPVPTKRSRAIEIASRGRPPVRGPVAEIERRLEVLDPPGREQERRRAADPQHEPREESRVVREEPARLRGDVAAVVADAERRSFEDREHVRPRGARSGRRSTARGP